MKKEDVLVAEASDQSCQGFGDAFGGYTVLSGYGRADASSVALVKVPVGKKFDSPFYTAEIGGLHGVFGKSSTGQLLR